MCQCECGRKPGLCVKVSVEDVTQRKQGICVKVSLEESKVYVSM